MVLEVLKIKAKEKPLKVSIPNKEKKSNQGAYNCLLPNLSECRLQGVSFIIFPSDIPLQERNPIINCDEHRNEGTQTSDWWWIKAISYSFRMGPSQEESYCLWSRGSNRGNHGGCWKVSYIDDQTLIGVTWAFKIIKKNWGRDNWVLQEISTYLR